MFLIAAMKNGAELSIVFTPTPGVTPDTDAQLSALLLAMEAGLARL